MNSALADQILAMADADQAARYHLLELENDPHATPEDWKKAAAQIHQVDTANLQKVIYCL